MDQSSSSHKLRRPKSREVSSRFLSPTSPNHHHHPLSPSRRKSASSPTRKPKPDLHLSSVRPGLWPSSTLKTFDTLADHIGNDRLKDSVDRKNSVFDRQRSSRRQQPLFESDKDNLFAKENHRPIIVGGSTRYTGKFNNFSSPSSSSTATSISSIVPGRFSVDGNNGRRFSDNFAEFLDYSGSECSETDVNHVRSPSFRVQSSTKSGMEVSSKYMNDVKHRRWTSDLNFRAPNSSADSSAKLNKFNLKNVIKRANSLTGSKFGTSQWALSPGRTTESFGKAAATTKSSFSNLKPPTSPSKKGVEKLLNLGFDLFKSKKSSSSSSRSLVRSDSGHVGVTEAGHQLRLLHNRVMQWRFTNARAEIVNAKVADQAQNQVLKALDGLVKLRQSVLHKKLKLQKEKLEMKLNFILHSQFKPLEAWGDMERQHMAALCMMKECLHSVVCKVPLIEGAEVDTQSAAINLRHAADLSASIKLMLATFAPSAEQTAVLLSELAEVVAQERLLSDECLELCKTISTLEMEERSLKCSIVQLESWKQEQTKLQQQQQPRSRIIPARLLI